jgi:ribonuclease E
MAKELIINASLPEIRIALMEDGRIQELLIERESDKGIVGNIYKGRVTRVLPGMQAAFVDVGLDKAAFLYVDDIYVHPKVMGEETEVVDDSNDEGDYDEPAPAPRKPAVITPRPSGSFVAKAASPETGNAAEGANEESAQADIAHEGTSEKFPPGESLDHAEQTLASEHANDAEADAEESEDEFEEEEDDATAAFEAAHDLDSDEGDSFESEDESEEDEETLEVSAESDSENNESGDENSNEENNGENPSHSLNDADVGNGEGNSEQSPEGQGSLDGLTQGQGHNTRNPRGRNRNRKRGRGKRGGTGGENAGRNQFAGGETEGEQDLPDNFSDTVNEGGQVSSDRAQMEGEGGGMSAQKSVAKKVRSEFKEPRARDRRIKTKHTRPRAQANIADLLKEGQEVIVQIAKDPIATKGARLTCHVSLPGRHLVCMPSIDHVGVSRRIERDDERRRLRDFVERNRPRKMGFIVRTASGGKDPESWIKQDIDYLSKLWSEIRGKSDDVSAPALVYEDLNSILRAIRDWVNEDIDKIIVDSRHHYTELQAFADRFMPALHEKLELYHGDVPIFDAYGISSELHRSLERKVWLKSGGYLVIDQAEALVAIDVNTGRYVGKKSLEDTILKTNIEAAEEIAHQLRLRNCGGIIICDFIDMEREDNRMRVYRALDEALKKDRARPTIQKISELGLVEMTRKRTRDTIIRTLCEPCTHCEGKGFVKSTLTVAYEILREIERLSVDREAKKVLVSAHETVVNALAIELRDALDQLERRYNKTVYLQTVMDFHTEQFEVVTDRAQGKKGAPDIARQLRMERERTERKEKNRVRQQPSQRSHQDSDEEVSAGGNYDESNEGSRDSHGGSEERNHQDRNNQDRNQNHRGGRNQNRDRNDRDSQSRNDREPRAPKEPKEAAAPIPRPSGSFVTTRAGAPTIAPAVIKMLDKSAQAANQASNQAAVAGESGASDDDAQPSFTERSQSGYEDEVQAGNADQSSSPGYEEELNDEDQLAYLRAQAAQDAAIAGLSQQDRNGNRPQANRSGRGGPNQAPGNGRGGQNNNNRNQNNRGGRNQNNNRGGQQAQGGNAGGQRFKPHHRGTPAVIQANANPGNANPGNSSAPTPAPERSQAPVEQQIPDYEVISRGDGSES